MKTGDTRTTTTSRFDSEMAAEPRPAQAGVAGEAGRGRGARDGPHVGKEPLRFRDRLVAAMDDELGAPSRRQARQDVRQPFALARVAALDVDDEPAVRKGRRHLVQRRHEADAFPRNGWVRPPSALSPWPMSSALFGEGILARDAGGVRAAVERPVVVDSEMPVRGRMDVELDEIGAGREGGPH